MTTPNPNVMLFSRFGVIKELEPWSKTATESGSVVRLTARGSSLPTTTVQVGGANASNVSATTTEVSFDKPTTIATAGTLNTLTMNGGGVESVLPRGFLVGLGDVVVGSNGIDQVWHDYISTFVRNRISGGCGSGDFCPDSNVTRAQMAIFLEISIHAPGYQPPGYTGYFADVPQGSFGDRFIEQFYREGITGGCGGGNYCPNNSVTRQEMAVFLLVSKMGKGFSPPAATGTMFADVPATSGYAAWIEELARQGITGGCGGGNFCPGGTVTRKQMAVFITKTFELQCGADALCPGRSGTTSEYPAIAEGVLPE